MSIIPRDSGVGALYLYFCQNKKQKSIEPFLKEYYGCVKFVFFRGAIDEGLDFIEKNHHFFSEIKIKQVHFIGVDPKEAKRVIAKLTDYFSINVIYISIADFYNYLESVDYHLRLEYWGNGFNEDVDDKLNTIKDYLPLIPFAEDIIADILQFNPQNDIEKIILLDLWIQKNIQFVKERETERKIDNDTKEVYVCESMGERVAHLEDVMINHFGRCQDISATVAIILNHPKINVHCRQIVVGEHSWNIVNVNGKEYYLDCTKNVSRNPNQVVGALKAFAYYPLYTLLGKKEYLSVDSEIFETSNISNESVDRALILEVVEKFKAQGVETNWGDFLVKESYLKKS